MDKQFDLKEIAALISGASGDFACVAEDFSSLEAIFEAIVAATESHTLAHRLAKFGMSTAENNSYTYDHCKDEMNAHAERYAKSLGLVEREDA